MKNQKRLLLIVCILALLVSLVSGCEETNTSSESPDTVTSSQIKKKESNESDTSVNKAESATEWKPIYYDKDEWIDTYLVNFNNANPDNKISNFQPYEHHGSVHDNQIILDYDGFEVVISSVGFSSRCQVVVTGYKSKKTNKESKSAFFRFARGFNPNLTDKQLEYYWSETWNDTYLGEFDVFECRLSVFNDVIEYYSIEGDLTPLGDRP